MMATSAAAAVVCLPGVGSAGRRNAKPQARSSAGNVAGDARRAVSYKQRLACSGWPPSAAGRRGERDGWVASRRRCHDRRGARTAAATASAATTAAEDSRTSSGSGQGMQPPFGVVITGSTKGVGLALAREFLQAGDAVFICSRTGTLTCNISSGVILNPTIRVDERVKSTLEELRKEFGKDRVHGARCDVSNAADVKSLAATAKQALGNIHLWINNAGSNAYTYDTLVNVSDDALRDIVQTNTLGVLLCCREAIRLMRDQKGGGHIFNMDGAGADGGATPRFAAYGATKRSLLQLSKSLQAELKLLGINNVFIHNLSPGMVTTELLMSGADTKTAKFFINILAEEANEVAQYLVPRVRAVPTGKPGNTYIKFLTKKKAYTQIFERLLLGKRKDRWVKEDAVEQ
eukprot:jgi/Chlat1/7091/Chrsp57S06729